ncbi:MAG: DUF2326 domain-containing protein [Gammaproteobacteria bacterium]|nr:DUF2326 domain-containing protein [Gammaproteobacteria bacterium]
MFLKSLTIAKGENIIREINFHKGVNLIVDETISNDDTGNSVGKTTVLRLINFCLGGNGENIYKDPEFKNKENNKIENFLKDNRILITLTLSPDLEKNNAREVIIEKNFLKGSQKILKINKEKIIVKEFDKALKQILLNFNLEKPTLKQIIAKNIRDEKNRLSNTVKVLNQYSTSAEYEALYLFWLGVSVDSVAEKQKLTLEQKALKKMIANIEKSGNLSQIRQSLKVVKDNIAELENKKNSYETNANYEADIKELNSVKSKLNKLSLKNTRLITRQNLILESKQDLEKEISTIDTQQIEYLYNKAKILIPNLQKSFENVLDFHNQMTVNKVEYITKELPQLTLDITKIESEIQRLSHTESKLSKKVYKNDVIEDLNKIAVTLNKNYEDKGKWMERKERLKTSRQEIAQIEGKLSSIDEEIESKDDAIQQKISIFNEYFSKISNKLYEESFILSSNKSNGCYGLDISSLDGNVGTGMKKGQIAAFDLAYIQFADKLKLKCLHFILHDQIETVHGNQILKILTNIVPEINCQYIAPILKDKLPSGLDVSKYTVLNLSQDEKLFKIY